MAIATVAGLAIENAQRVDALKRQAELLRSDLKRQHSMVGETAAMQEVYKAIGRVAGQDVAVLILGESGTGKELVARGIHALSPRRHRPFIAVNVAALPETLLESELFGHEKGAFTGAAALRKGFFELAHGGTIFLDEIGEMPLSTQTKLLRVLEEREFRRVGGEDTLRVDVRVLAATNRDPRTQVATGEFRRDLYHRINVLRIDLPPLRERRADIPRLIDGFIRQFSAEHDRPFVGIDPEAVRVLVEYDWPGNVRELRNLVESMVVLAPGRVIHADHIPAEVRYHRGTSRSLMPVPVTVSAAAPVPQVQPVRVAENGAAGPPPELEFIFRTMFEMRMDLDDLHREFDLYKQRHRDPGALPPSYAPALPWPAVPVAEPEPPEEKGVVVFRPGMTMQDLEREAISAALREARGNRRRAAEMLGIGERTLYRKLKEYNLET
jgi:DNA-binding NtrC family response regulator